MATSIFPALSIKPPTPPAQEIGEVLAVKNAAQQNELGDIQLQNARAAQLSQQTLMNLYAKNNGDLNQTYADAVASGKVLPEHLSAFRTQAVAAQVQLANLQEKDLTNLDRMHDIVANELAGVKALPVDQRPQGIKDAVGRILQAGGPNTAQWLIPDCSGLGPKPNGCKLHPKRNADEGRAVGNR